MSEQSVKTGYLPRSVGERTGQTPEGLDKHRLTANLFLFQFVYPSSQFDLLFIHHFESLQPVHSLSCCFLLNSIFTSLSCLCSALPPTPVFPWPLFLCLSLSQHNACLRKEVETYFILLPPPPLPSSVSYKGTVDTLVWTIFHAESN